MSTRAPASRIERERRRRELMERVQAGDRDAYRALLEDIRPPLRALLRRWVSDPHDLEDVYQDVLVDLHRARNTYQPSRPLEPWLFAIARHVASNHNRRRLRRLSREVLSGDVPERGGEPGAVGTARLSDALERLPPRQREAFEMLKVEGLSVEAAATRAGTTTGALKVRAHRAYRAIRTLLAR